MSSVEVLRDFICERLTAAAAEIFSQFEKTVARYEEEIDRQRRLLDVTGRPGTNRDAAGALPSDRVSCPLVRLDLPEQHVYKTEESQTNHHQERPSEPQHDECALPSDRVSCPLVRLDLPEQHVYKTEESQTNHHQERPSEPPHDECEPPHVSEHQEEPLSSEDEGQPLVKQEPGAFRVTSAHEESLFNEAQSNSGQLVSHSLPVVKKQDRDSGSGESTQLFLHHTSSDSSNNENDAPASESSCITRRDQKSVCGKAFKTKHQMKARPKTCKNQKRSVCNALGRALRHPSGEKPYSCKTCGRSFSCNSNLKAHVRSHAGERRYFCIICGTTFPQRSLLNCHLKIHGAENRKPKDKAFSCNTCGKKYTARASLVIHVRSHTGERPYSCEMCGRKFSRKSNCTIHMRMHTGERPYACKLCETTFTNKAALRYHMRVHSA